jgi:hypothetical protein
MQKLWYGYCNGWQVRSPWIQPSQAEIKDDIGLIQGPKGRLTRDLVVIWEEIGYSNGKRIREKYVFHLTVVNCEPESYGWD